MFPFMCATDKVWITELTLLHKNIRSVRNSHIGESDVKHIMTSPIKTIALILKVSTDIVTVSHLFDCDTGDKVCLDLQNCRYSIFIN